MSDLDDLNPNRTDRVIAKALDASGQAQSNEIRLSTGVILLAKQANPNILIRIITAQKRPTPPVHFIEAMGREMENPEDPDYISRVKAWEMDYNNGLLNALVGLGTSIKYIPPGMEGPDPISVDGKTMDPQWIRDYEALGLPVIRDSAAWRYITWVLYKAAVLDTDTKEIGEKVKALSGVKEADVRDAETFPAGN